jgi:hypothetical protein
MTFTGHNMGAPVTVPIAGSMDTGFPAVAGHIGSAGAMGVSAPGVAFQLQVVKIPGR